MEEECAIVKYKDNKLDPDIEKLLDDTESITKSDFYKVGGKTVPGARALQYDANRKRISTKVLAWDSDDFRAYAHVAGWIGDEDNPIQYKEAIVEIVYRIESTSWVLNKAGRGMKIERNADGVPLPADNKDKGMLHDYMLRKRQYGIREVITKAEAIVNKKLLSMEFREKEEIESEVEEIEAVRQQKALQQRGHKRDTNTNTYGTYNKYGTVPKKDPPRSTIVKQDEPPIETTYSTDNKYSIVVDDHDSVKGEGVIKVDAELIVLPIKTATESDKRDFLVAISNNKDHPLHEKVMKLL
jgi:hypothetical protein